MKKILKITESDLLSIVSESVTRILKESDLSYTQLKNILGVSDNDEWNAASEAERHEELESSIWNDMKELAGGNPRNIPFSFQDLAKTLEDKYGFKYDGADDENESHEFTNGKDTLTVYPNIYYPRQGMMKISNFHVM